MGKVKITPPPAIVFLLNRSTLVHDDDAAAIAAAVDVQLTRDFCPAWGLAPVRLQFATGGKAPAGAPWLALLDTLDVADAAGYHTEDGHGAVYGYAGVKASLSEGGKVLTGPYSVASIVSHEALELAADRHCEKWADTGQGWEIAAEVCDPVQDGTYDVDGVTVSSFVMPDYFDPHAKRRLPLDILGALRKPFSMTRGGYYVRREVGQESDQFGHAEAVFGEAVPRWLRAAKESSSHTRTCHRVSGRTRGLSS